MNEKPVPCSFPVHFIERGGIRAKLTSIEARILEVLSRMPGRSHSQREIIERIWGADYLDSSISIPAYIRRLREKIEDDPSNPAYLKTVWGFGYQLFCDDQS